MLFNAPDIVPLGFSGLWCKIDCLPRRFLVYRTEHRLQDEMAMTYVLHRTMGTIPPTIVSGEGNFLIDAEGRRYLDACGGAAVSCIGHDIAKVKSAIAAQFDKVAYSHTSFFTNEPAEELAEFLVARAPARTGDGRVMYLGSGSEAMEAALKLARQYHLEKGESSRIKIIARKPSYHGNTLGALAASGHHRRRAPFQPLLMHVEHIEAAYPYRLRQPGESETDFALRMANLLDERICEIGAGRVMAFVAEPVVGASLGTQPAPTGYFNRIREICDAHGVLLIADEVMCGMGRTGTLFALAQEGIHADITTIAKGLGAGYQPIAGVLASKTVVDAIENGSRTLWNGHTFMSHAIATAGALAVQRFIEEEDLLQNVRRRGAQLGRTLRNTFGQHRYVGNIRGRGLFWSVELVANRESKEPFATSYDLAPRIQRQALARGVMTYPVKGCADGIRGDHVLLAPSYTSSVAEIDHIVSILSDSIGAALEA